MIIKTFNTVCEDFTIENRETSSFDITNTEELFSAFMDILNIFEINDIESLRKEIEKEIEGEIREKVEEEIDDTIKIETTATCLQGLVDGYNAYESALNDIEYTINHLDL